MNVIKPWFYTSNATHTDPWFRPEANGGSSLFTVVYNGTTDSVSRIQSKYWSDKNQFGGNLQGVEDTYLMTTGNVVPDTLVGMLVVLYQ